MVQIRSEYRDTPPVDVRVWEQQVGMAATHEEAQTQLLYALNLQTLKLRRFVQWAVAWAVGVTVLSAVLTVVLMTS